MCSDPRRWILRAVVTGIAALVAAGAGAQGLVPRDAPAQGFGPDMGTEGSALGGGGDLAFGLSYGNREGVAALIELTQERLFGTDEHLRFHIEGARFFQSLGLSLTDADFLERPIERTIRLEGFNVAPDEEFGQRYGYAGADLSLAFARQVGNGVVQRAGVGISQYQIDVVAGMPVAVTAHVAAYGAETQLIYVFGGIDIDRAESGFLPGRGWRAAANLEVGQASDTGYAKLTFGGEVFHRLGGETTLRAHAGVGLSTVSGGGDLPLFKTYQGGGVGSVRGFVAGTLGPVSAIPGSTEVAYPGGQSAWAAGIEIARALPATEGLKAVAFLDLGGISASGDPFAAQRSSVGVGMSWESPIGPLSVFAAQPLDDQPGDRIENVQIVYGVRF